MPASAATPRNSGPDHSGTDGFGSLGCPYCGAYEVARLFLASLHLDSCCCASCGARWDQDPESGTYRGRVSRTRT